MIGTILMCVGAQKYPYVNSKGTGTNGFPVLFFEDTLLLIKPFSNQKCKNEAQMACERYMKYIYFYLAI